MPIQTLEQGPALATSPLSGPSQPTLCDLCNHLNLETLRGQVIELEARVQASDTFARTVAHDLKGPLGTMAGLAIVLKQDYGQMSLGEQQQFLGDLVSLSRKLNNVVDELLLLAELREADVVMEALCMAEVVAEAQKRLAPMIEDYEAEIVLPVEWPAAEGYGPWVEEVWVNYLSNAIKYGGRPPRVELNAATQLDGSVCFWAQDNGPGIALADQGRLFEPFTRLDRARASGHGLGLAVVRQIVEKLGGQIGVSSVPGHGSVFSFTLPGCSLKNSCRGGLQR